MAIVCTGRADRLEKLIQANQSLAYIESLDELLSNLLNLSQEVTDAEASSILLWNEDGQCLEFAMAKNSILGEKVSNYLKDHVTLKLGEGIAGTVAQSGESVLVRDALADERVFRRADETTGFQTRSLICVPVFHATTLLGVIQVLNSRSSDGFDRADQGILESFANLAAVAIVRSNLLAERVKRERLQSQLEAASRIQSQFWPLLPDLGDAHHVWAVSEPATFVGGDLYDVIAMPDGRWLMYVADVSGKGLPASLIMAALWSRIRSESTRHDRAEDILSAVNHSLFDFLSGDGKFVTILLCMYEPKSGRIEMVTGGHLAPVLVDCDGGLREPEVRGFPLGIMPNADFTCTECTLKPGASLVIVTDGVTEARDMHGRMYDEHRLHKQLCSCPVQKRGPSVVDDVLQWRGNAEPSDDMTLLELHRNLES